MIVEVIPQRMMRDCGSIALRSRFDRTAIAAFFHEVSRPSDGDPGNSDDFDRTITFGLMRDRGPCDEDHRAIRVMEIGRTGNLRASPR